MVHFETGDKVNILSMSYGGDIIVEGRATIVDVIDAYSDFYLVQFEGDERGPRQRNVDPLAQGDDVDDYVRELNSFHNAMQYNA